MCIYYLNGWQEKAKERQLKEEMEREIREKDKQLQDLLAHHRQVRYLQAQIATRVLRRWYIEVTDRARVRR